MIFGHVMSQIVATVARLGLADELAGARDRVMIWPGQPAQTPARSPVSCGPQSASGSSVRLELANSGSLQPANGFDPTARRCFTLRWR